MYEVVVVTGDWESMRSLPPTLEATMQDVADQSAAPTTIRADLCAIFVSLELELIDLAGHIAVARPRGEDVQAQRVCRGISLRCWRAFFCFPGGKRARGPENPPQSSSFKKRGWTGFSGFTVSC